MAIKSKINLQILFLKHGIGFGKSSIKTGEGTMRIIGNSKLLPKVGSLRFIWF